MGAVRPCNACTARGYYGFCELLCSPLYVSFAPRVFPILPWALVAMLLAVMFSYVVGFALLWCAAPTASSTLTTPNTITTVRCFARRSPNVNAAKNEAKPSTAPLIAAIGSLALTGLGHGTDRASVAGLEGNDPQTVDTEYLADVHRICDERGTIRLAGVKTITFDYNHDIGIQIEDAEHIHEYMCASSWVLGVLRSQATACIIAAST